MNCRHCGSDCVISIGPRIKCKSCGRQSVKILRLNTPSMESRPACPDCGSPDPYAGGTPKGVPRNWICRSCGRNYSSLVKVDKAEPLIMEVQIE